MATRKSPASKAAAVPKAASAKTSAKGGTSRKGVSADPSAGFRDAMVKPLKGLAERLQALKVSGTAGAVLESGRKDLAALIKANEKSYQGLQSVVARQTEMLRSSITDWQSTVSQMPGKDPKENLAKLDEMGRAAFQRALDDIRELAELAARSQSDAFEVVRQRISENVDQVSRLLTKERGKT